MTPLYFILDFIYREQLIQEHVNELSDVNRKIHEYTTTFSTALAVKARRNIIARTIDTIAESIHPAHVLALACGHLREAKQSQAVKKGKIEKYVALDSDNESLQVVNAELSECGVTCIQKNIEEIIIGKNDLGTFDFVYAAGLFDYLRDSVAKRLTQNMFKLLRPNGRILICNFLRNIIGIGYMESFMDWKLVYRDLEDMDKLASVIPNSEIAGKDIFVEENKNIVFLKIQKK